MRENKNEKKGEIKMREAQKIYQTQSLSTLTYIEPHIYIQIFPLIQSLLRISQFSPQNPPHVLEVAIYKQKDGFREHIVLPV